jgi:hypothetical protein
METFLLGRRNNVTVRGWGQRSLIVVEPLSVRREVKLENLVQEKTTTTVTPTIQKGRKMTPATAPPLCEVIPPFSSWNSIMVLVSLVKICILVATKITGGASPQIEAGYMLVPILLGRHCDRTLHFEENLS